MTVGIWPSGDGRWVIVGELRWSMGYPGSLNVLVVRDGFVTDLASIPRWLHWLVNPFDPATAPAAIIHDAMLAQGYEQRRAANEFRRRLEFDGFPAWKRTLFYLAVVIAIRS